MKKVVFGVVALLVAAGALCGCGKDKADSGKLSLSVGVYDNGNIPASEGSVEENRWTKWINEQCGVDVTFVPIIRNQATQKINSMLAAGNAPDIFSDYSADYVGQLVQQGAIMPLDEAIEKYSVDYKKYLEENPKLKMYTTYDGNIYAITNQRPDDAIVNHSVWIRQDWLDKLGLEMPKTDAELIEVMKQFRDKDPNGNGQKDEVPMSMIWSQLIEAMYECTEVWYVNEKDEMEFGQLTDRYVEALRFMKTCYDEGLLSREFATDKDNTMQNQLWTTDRAGVYMRSWSPASNRDLMINNPNAKPVILPPVETKFGVGGYYKETDAQLYNMFNASTKNVEAGMKFIDWMITDGWEKLYYGDEGVHYTLVDGYKKKTDPDKFKTEVGYANAYAIVNQKKSDPKEYIIGAADDDVSQAIAQQQVDSFNTNVEKNDFRRDIPRTPDVAEYSALMTQWSVKRNETRIKVITGGPECSPEWGLEQLRSEWDRLGGQEVNKLVNEWYQNNKDKFSELKK